MRKNKLKIAITAAVTLLTIGVGNVDAALYSDLPTSKITDNFPDSYKSYIEELKKTYPNATFKAVETGLDWDTVVKHETYEVNVGISTIHKSYDAAWKKDGVNNFVDGPYVTASKEAVEYVLDPRNSLSQKYIFQFELLTYVDAMNETVIDKVLAGTELVGEHKSHYQHTTAGNWLDLGMTYSQLISKVAKEQNVSAVYIASRMKQETGGKLSTNGSINGISKDYPGVYNFFNIGATPNSDGSGAITNGLKKAKEKGWTTPYLSISGGVDVIKSKYIKYGQYSVYFQKFDVNNPYGNAKTLMKMQYQTNILAPRSESLISYAAYEKLGMLDTSFVFYIPVYNNMPTKACKLPGTTEKTDSIIIGDFGISGIEPGMTVDELKAKIVADNLTIVVKNAEGKTLEDAANVTTGTKVELITEAGEVAESYDVVIYGDVDGDGNIYATDYVKIKNHIMDEKKALQGPYKEAADVNKDNNIYATDYVVIKNYIMGKGTISQK